MKEMIRGLKWYKLILVAVLLGGLLGAIDSGLVSQTAYGNPPEGCPNGTYCQSNGCSYGAGGFYCNYTSIGGGTCPSISCPNNGL